jgi:hypothetical protein
VEDLASVIWPRNSARLKSEAGFAVCDASHTSTALSRASRPSPQGPRHFPLPKPQDLSFSKKDLAARVDRLLYLLNMMNTLRVAAPAAALLAGGCIGSTAKLQGAKPYEADVLSKLKNIEDSLANIAQSSKVASVRTAHSNAVDAQRIAYAAENLEKVLYTSEEIDERVRELGAAITKEYEGKDVIVVGLLSGVFMFFSDLVRNIEVPHKIDFMVVSSYGESSVSSANVKIKKDLSMSVEGKHVRLVVAGKCLELLFGHYQFCFPAPVVLGAPGG